MPGLLLAAALAAVALVAIVLTIALVTRNIHLWLGSYLRQAARDRPAPSGPVHIFLCVADHFEPMWNGASHETERARVDRWMRDYPVLADRHRDADGRPPRYTFFYPAEEYRPEHLEKLAALCARGYGEVEVHLHHGNDTARGVEEKLTRFAETLHRDHGLLRTDGPDGRIAYGFVHGDWALDNSRGSDEWCGVNDELRVLKETGCFADFTLPAPFTTAQTRKINSIYYAEDDPNRPKSHDTGRDVEVGVAPSGDLMIIQGPLSFNWRWRKWGVLPRVETGELSADNPPTPDRARLWVRQHIHVRGRPEWVFVKLHTHGAQEKNTEILLGGSWDRTLTFLEEEYNDGERYVLHYVTAREMYGVIKAAERGETRIELG